MKNNKRVITTITHRLDTIEILSRHLQAQRDQFDEWHIWANTKDAKVLSVLHTMPAKIISPSKSNPLDGLHNVHFFYKEDAIETNTDYLKIDDDVVWLEPNFIKTMFEHKERYRDDFFLIFPCIINNAVISHILMRNGIIPWHDRCWYGYMDAVAWGSSLFAENLHRLFLSCIYNNSYPDWHFKKWILDPREQVSINAICWSGDDMLKIVQSLNGPDEFWLNNYGPSMLNKQSLITGDTICSHYSFHVQKNHLDKTSILDEYKKLSDSV